ncbi:MAG: AraC family transcriptional regulator [Acidobacteria bacterium]|nr:MAG: AraC family transcriptional regulator [Acidobacteriota bacterium]
MHNETWSMERVPIGGPDDLREATRGADLEIVQLRPGKLRGSIKHFGIGTLGISTGQFSSETRVRGTMHRERVVLGTLLESAGRSTQWWTEIQPGDVGIFPAHAEIDVIHGGVTDYLVVSIPLQELSLMLGGEERLSDPAFWNTKGVYHTDYLARAEMLQRLKGIMSAVEHRFDIPSAEAADFLRRSILEAFVASLTSALPPARGRSYTGARLVSETEDYVDAAGGRPVHISELCNVLKVSRRSLHRAFDDTLGMGPTAYLRRRRLSAIHSVLRRSDPAAISIGDLAFEYGFPETGRFAAYYREHFGETPSETCRSGKGKGRQKDLERAPRKSKVLELDASR